MADLSVTTSLTYRLLLREIAVASRFAGSQKVSEASAVVNWGDGKEAVYSFGFQGAVVNVLRADHSSTPAPKHAVTASALEARGATQAFALLYDATQRQYLYEFSGPSAAECIEKYARDERVNVYDKKFYLLYDVLTAQLTALAAEQEFFHGALLLENVRVVGPADTDQKWRVQIVNFCPSFDAEFYKRRLKPLCAEAELAVFDTLAARRWFSTADFFALCVVALGPGACTVLAADLAAVFDDAALTTDEHGVRHLWRTIQEAYGTTHNAKLPDAVNGAADDDIRSRLPDTPQTPPEIRPKRKAMLLERRQRQLRQLDADEQRSLARLAQLGHTVSAELQLSDGDGDGDIAPSLEELEQVLAGLTAPLGAGAEPGPAAEPVTDVAPASEPEPDTALLKSLRAALAPEFATDVAEGPAATPATDVAPAPAPAPAPELDTALRKRLQKIRAASSVAQRPSRSPFETRRAVLAKRNGRKTRQADNRVTFANPTAWGPITDPFPELDPSDLAARRKK
jgi:hypothetical protein